MNLLHLRYFVELARQQHFTRAAETLCITQPTLSHAMRQLEQELGVPLFEKRGRMTQLTCCGKQFLTYAEESLSCLDKGIDLLQQTGRGEGVIRLGFLRTLGIDFVPRLAAEFLRAHPDRHIRFSFHTGNTGQLLAGLSAREYDLVFASRPSEELGFTSVPVNRQDLVLIVPPDHPLASRTAIDLAETLPYPLISFSKGSGLRDVITHMYDQIGAYPPVVYETEEDQVAAGLATQGFGIAIVPRMELLQRLDVKILPIQNPSQERNFYLINDDRSFQPPAVSRFRRFVLDRSGL